MSITVNGQVCVRFDFTLFDFAGQKSKHTVSVPYDGAKLLSEYMTLAGDYATTLAGVSDAAIRYVDITLECINAADAVWGGTTSTDFIRIEERVEVNAVSKDNRSFARYFIPAPKASILEPDQETGKLGATPLSTWVAWLAENACTSSGGQNLEFTNAFRATTKDRKKLALGVANNLSRG